MIKSRVAQIVFQTVYCSLSIIAIISSLGFFDKEFNGEFYIWYTNLSNYICMFVMFMCLIITIRQTKQNLKGYVSYMPKFTFCTMIMILVTLLIYNTLLVGDKTASDYFLSIGNLLMHLILPIMFIVHWTLFYEHDKTKWYYPLLSLIMPLTYVVLIFVRAGILFGKEVTLYPYFFLNLEALGWGGVIKWVIILLAVFIVLSYIIFLLDNIKTIKVKIQNRKVINSNLGSKSTSENFSKLNAEDTLENQESNKLENSKINNEDNNSTNINENNDDTSIVDDYRLANLDNKSSHKNGNKKISTTKKKVTSKGKVTKTSNTANKKVVKKSSTKK